MTKPIIVVKMPCKLLYVILNKMFNFLALLDIRVFGRLTIVASDWPRTFL